MNIFYDDYGVTGLGVIAIIIAIIISLAIGANKHAGWQCSNYNKMTGFEVKYIDYDACYIKGSDGSFVRYDSNYKSVK